MFKRKISSYFQRETDKIIDEAEESTKNKFHKEDNDARLPDSKPRNIQTTWLNEHKWWRYENNAMSCHFCRLANKKNHIIVLKVFTFPWTAQRQFIGQHKDNINVVINYALSPAIAYLSLCKDNRGTNCLLRQLSWLKHWLHESTISFEVREVWGHGLVNLHESLIEIVVSVIQNVEVSKTYVDKSLSFSCSFLWICSWTLTLKWVIEWEVRVFNFLADANSIIHYSLIDVSISWSCFDKA